MKEEKGAPLYLAVHGLLTIADTTVPDGTLLLPLWLKKLQASPCCYPFGTSKLPVECSCACKSMADALPGMALTI
jgi:hypothetical protein